MSGLMWRRLPKPLSRWLQDGVILSGITREARYARGLVEHGMEAVEMMREAVRTDMPIALRPYFALILVNNEGANARALWDDFRNHLAEDTRS